MMGGNGGVRTGMGKGRTHASWYRRLITVAITPGSRTTQRTWTIPRGGWSRQSGSGHQSDQQGWHVFIYSTRHCSWPIRSELSVCVCVWHHEIDQHVWWPLRHTPRRGGMTCYAQYTACWVISLIRSCCWKMPRPWRRVNAASERKVDTNRLISHNESNPSSPFLRNASGQVCSILCKNGSCRDRVY